MLEGVIAGEGTPQEVVDARGLAVVSDDGALIAAIDEALASQPDVLEKIRDGKVQAAGAVIGAVMKAMKGQADAARVRELVLERASASGAVATQQSRPTGRDERADPFGSALSSSTSVAAARIDGMGRGDGSGRVVSPDGADDTGTGILHVDMDAFYASVEQLDDPSLRGKPIIIGAPESRSVVSSASYEARRFGVRSAMPVGQALRLCPTAIVVLPHFDRYLEMSAQVMRIFRDVTPLVEPLSIDEAFLDVRGARRLWGSPGRDRARAAPAGARRDRTHLQHRRRRDEARREDRLDGQQARRAADRRRGRHRRRSCARCRSARCGASVRRPRSRSRAAASTPSPTCSTRRAQCSSARSARRWASAIWHLARGIDPRQVDTHRVDKSVGHEETFHDDIADDAILRSELRRLADKVGARLRSNGWEASTIAIKVRFADLTTISRSQTLPEPTAVGQRIGDAAHELFASVDRALPVRLIGVRAEKLRPRGSAVLTLWDDDEDWRRIEDALDGAAARFGRGAVTRATLLGKARGGGHAARRTRGPPAASD